MPFFLILAMLLIGSCLRAANWPQFRGPEGSGVGNGDMPVQFSPTSNVLWKAEMPAGHSSPVIWNNRIFLSAFENDELQTLCISRKDGSVLWKRALKPTRIERSARDSHPATSTPC